MRAVLQVYEFEELVCGCRGERFVVDVGIELDEFEGGIFTRGTGTRFGPGGGEVVADGIVKCLAGRRVVEGLARAVDSGEALEWKHDRGGALGRCKFAGDFSTELGVFFGRRSHE